MIFFECTVYAFGKLKNKKIALRPGMNVLTGGNGSGKTTLSEFLAAMLFGMDEETTRKYYPRVFEGQYGGSVSVLADGGIYKIERSFDPESPRFYVTDTKNGKLIEDPEQWILNILGGLTRETFAASGYFSEQVFLKDRMRYADTPEKHKASEKENSVREDYARAKEILLAERKNYEAQKADDVFAKLKKTEEDENEARAKVLSLQQALSEKTRDMKAENEALASVCRDTEEDTAKKERMLKAAYENKKDEWEAEKKSIQKMREHKNTLGILFFVAMILCGAAEAFYMFSYKILEKKMFTDVLFLALGAGVLVFLILGILFTVHSAKTVKRGEKLSEKDSATDTEMAAAKKMLSDFMTRKENNEFLPPAYDEKVNRLRALKKEIGEMQEEIKKKTELIASLEEKKEALKESGKDQQDIQKEIKAIDIAIAAFDRLGHLTGEDEWDILSETAENILSSLGEETSGELFVKDDMAVILQNGECIPVNELSNAAAEAVYFSVRLAKLQLADPENRLPVFIDNAFGKWDDSRYQKLLQALRSLGRQVIFFASRGRDEG